MFCLLTVYLIVSSLYRSDDSIYHAKCVFFVMYCFMQSVYCLNSLSTRLGIVVVVQRNDKNTCVVATRRNDLLCNTVAAGVMNSVSTFWHGVKVDRPPEVTPVRRACAYVERRSGLLDVAYRRANLRHEPLTF